MYTRPNIGSIIDAVILSLNRDLAPELQSSRAKVCLTMVCSILQGVAQRAGSEAQLLACEQKEMVGLFRALAERLRDSQGAAAERIRERGESLGRLPELPTQAALKELQDTHHQLSEALICTLDDLDELLRAGDGHAEDALRLLRSHLAARTERDLAALAASQNSLAGRG